MKKLTLTLFAALISISMFADKDVEASLCWHDKTISITELRNCSEITLNNEAYKIFSYKLGFVHKHDNTQDYIEFTGVDKNINTSFTEKFKDYTPEKLYLEEIIVVDKNNEKYKLENVVIIVTK
ncbi:MAG: hypothetical protein H6587_08580 [Flavobacteriales bacterium]|nr:hypothetical protein [Flavobacteriales bacterium]MCB9364610.1 hypothetical protein [Flavobacteriales bacterium]